MKYALAQSPAARSRHDRNREQKQHERKYQRRDVVDARRKRADLIELDGRGVRQMVRGVGEIVMVVARVGNVELGGVAMGFAGAMRFRKMDMRAMQADETHGGDQIDHRDLLQEPAHVVMQPSVCVDALFRHEAAAPVNAQASPPPLFVQPPKRLSPEHQYHALARDALQVQVGGDVVAFAVAFEVDHHETVGAGVIVNMHIDAQRGQGAL